MDDRNAGTVDQSDAAELSEVSARLEKLQVLLGRAPRILLAEDDNDVRWALSSLLEIDGFHVCSVSNGVELVEEVSSSFFDSDEIDAPDAIVTDVRMPGFYIFNIIEEMRMSDVNIPIVIVSGLQDEEVKKKTHDLGLRFFTKPVDFSVLEEALISVIESHLAAKEDAKKIQ